MYMYVYLSIQPTPKSFEALCIAYALCTTREDARTIETPRGDKRRGDLGDREYLTVYVYVYTYIHIHMYAY